MKIFKRALAALLCVLLVSGVTLVSGGATADEPYFDVSDAEKADAKYQAIKAAVEVLAANNATYQNLLIASHELNEPMTDEQRTQLAELTEKVNAAKEVLFVEPGAEIIASHAYELTPEEQSEISDGESMLTEWIGRGTYIDFTASVGLVFTPGALFNEYFDNKYYADAKTDPARAPYSANSKSYAATAAPVEIEQSKTFYSPPEWNSNFPEGKRQIFPSYYLGSFGYMIGSWDKDELPETTSITVPGIGGKAMGMAPNATLDKLANAKSNPRGMYPFLPRSINLAYENGMPLVDDFVWVAPLLSVRFYGRPDQSFEDLQEDLIPIDLSCTYKGQNGDVDAKFLGWMVTNIERIKSLQASKSNLYDYEITLEAQWGYDESDMPWLASKDASAGGATVSLLERTWNWILERLMNWVFPATRVVWQWDPSNPDDDSSEAIPGSGALLEGLIAWLMPFADWLGTVTGFSIMDTLADLGISF
ncbi:MAG: hypothetical protein LBB67_05410 [Oscillospiraceae bacterium]|jgi:hypothetical protein|nr:hypothetical protein [Oscillospiraceae bacterium]